MLNSQELQTRKQRLFEQLQKLEATIPKLQSQADGIRGQIQLIEEILEPGPEPPPTEIPMKKETKK